MRITKKTQKRLAGTLQQIKAGRQHTLAITVQISTGELTGQRLHVQVPIRDFALALPLDLELRLRDELNGRYIQRMEYRQV